MTNWFEVNKQGLAKLLERRGKEFVLYELIQNAWDQNVKGVNVTLKPIEGQPYCTLVVTDDDPEGFKDLSHAFTLFAESTKKGDAEKRGRFNLGEKLVLALCRSAEILTTTGGVRFDADGRTATRQKTNMGSMFRGEIRMTREEYAEVCEKVKTLLPPAGIDTYFNAKLLEQRAAVALADVSLPTEIANEEGVLRRTRRNTTIAIFEPRAGETAMLYEMGIPVVETGDKYHVNVYQKVPLNMDRDNVTPAYLREIRTAVLNATAQKLSPSDLLNDRWIRDGAADETVDGDAMARVMDLRFGPKRVIYDPSDLEANKTAVSQGYTVIHGSMLSGAEWDNVKRLELAKPAGQVTPTPKPFDPNGRKLKVIPPEEWDFKLRRRVEAVKFLAKRLMYADISVVIANDSEWGFVGAYGREDQRLTVNLAKIPRFATEDRISEATLEFLLHEFGHQFGGHLDAEYHDAICRLGARLALLFGNSEQETQETLEHLGLI
jgi:hypothetical protein